MVKNRRFGCKAYSLETFSIRHTGLRGNAPCPVLVNVRLSACLCGHHMYGGLSQSATQISFLGFKNPSMVFNIVGTCIHPKQATQTPTNANRAVFQCFSVVGVVVIRQVGSVAYPPWIGKRKIIVK
jgi:hypothetical protein